MAKTKPYNPTLSKTQSTKGTLLYLFLLPLFVSVIMALLQTNIKAFIVNSIAFILFFVTAKLSTKGLVQEKEYLLSTLTKAPKIPYKSLSAFTLGGATFFTASIAGGKPLTIALFLGLIAILGYFLYYGFDPQGDKLENLGDISAEFVLETIGEAKSKLAKVTQNLEHIKERELRKKIEIALQKAEVILETIQKDPKDIRVARKFLIVYIDGTLKVTDAYVAMDEKDINNETKEKLYGLMAELDRTFDKELERLKNNNLFDLDVHIDVLNQQIRN